MNPVGYNENNIAIQSNIDSINRNLIKDNKKTDKIIKITEMPPEKTMSTRKIQLVDIFDNLFARRRTVPDTPSYYNEMIDSFDLKSNSATNNSHNVITGNVSEKNFDKKRVIEKVKPKNEVSGLIDKNLTSHIIPPTSLVSIVKPKNQVKNLNLYRKTEAMNMPPIVVPIDLSNRETIVSKK